MRREHTSKSSEVSERNIQKLNTTVFLCTKENYGIIHHVKRTDYISSQFKEEKKVLASSLFAKWINSTKEFKKYFFQHCSEIEIHVKKKKT